MVENVIQIKSRITKNVDVIATTWEKIVCVKKTIFEILAHVLQKILYKVLLVVY